MSRVIFALLWAAHFLPDRLLSAIGNAVGLAAFWLIPERRRITRVNLEKCFPDMNNEDREALARAHFRVFCRSFVDRALLWWAPRARIEQLVRIEGLDRLRANPGAPVLLLVPHFAGLEAGFARLACEVDMVAFSTRQKDARFDELLRRGRSRFGDQRLLSRQDGIRATSCVRWPSENDFGCGFHSALSLGTRSINRRVVAISWSNSGSSVSAMPMVCTLRSREER